MVKSGCLLVLCSLAVVFAAQLNSTIETKYGWISGGLDSSKTHKVWYGVPYARAPVGPLRWQLPQPPLNWTGVKQTTSFGAACSQPDVVSSEDCLFLNVNTPVNWTTDSPLLPVMIWIHGGSFWGGSGAVRPAYLAGNDMVFVSINYRLGAFGFFNLPGLIAGNAERTAGFYGIQDQRFAFKWVQENIESFGGDPNRVTISGQSAGAMSVCIHVACPRSAGLFHRALMESGLCNQFLTTAQATATTTNVAKKLNCTGDTIISCLYNQSADALNDAMIYGPIWPSFNEYEIQAQPIEYIRNGTYNKVPMLAGTNHDEQSFQTCPNYGTINSTQYNSTLQRIYSNPTYLYVTKMYPLSSYSPPVAGITAAWSDSRFRYPTLDMISAMSKRQTIPVYLYSFNQVPSYQTDECLKASHSTELGFVFPGSFSKYQAGEVQLSYCMREYWVSFVTGNPPTSTTCKVTWTQYVDSLKNHIEFKANVTNATVSIQNDFLLPYYTFWQNPAAYDFSVPFTTTTTAKGATTATTGATTNAATTAATGAKTSTTAATTAKSSTTDSSSTSASSTTTAEAITSTSSTGLPSESTTEIQSSTGNQLALFQLPLLIALIIVLL